MNKFAVLKTSNKLFETLIGNNVLLLFKILISENYPNLIQSC